MGRARRLRLVLYNHVHNDWKRWWTGSWEWVCDLVRHLWLQLLGSAGYYLPDKCSTGGGFHSRREPAIEPQLMLDHGAALWWRFERRHSLDYIHWKKQFQSGILRFHRKGSTPDDEKRWRVCWGVQTFLVLHRRAYTDYCQLWSHHFLHRYRSNTAEWLRDLTSLPYPNHNQSNLRPRCLTMWVHFSRGCLDLSRHFDIQRALSRNRGEAKLCSWHLRDTFQDWSWLSRLVTRVHNRNWAAIEAPVGWWGLLGKVSNLVWFRSISWRGEQ